jgi:hypothetical protein
MRSKHDSVSPARDMGNGLTLNVNVLKAKDLAAKDRSGTSDPVSPTPTPSSTDLHRRVLPP